MVWEGTAPKTGVCIRLFNSRNVGLEEVGADRALLCFLALQWEMRRLYDASANPATHQNLRSLSSAGAV